MRRTVATVLLTLLAATAAAGCGDDESGATPAPPELTVPRTEPAHTTDETSPLTTPAAPGAGGGAPGGGAQAPQPPAQQQDTPKHDVKPAPGTPESRFEKFCDENPGACG